MTALPFPFPVVSWSEDAVVLIDQTRLPAEISWRSCRDVPALCQAIQELAVRGAPALGIAAGFGLALSWRLSLDGKRRSAEILAGFQADRQILAATRPTAVNLFWALDRVGSLAERMVAAGQEADAIGQALVAEARSILDEDIAMCRQLGQLGAELLPASSTVLTHCNAGGLATGGYGTALGVIYAAVEIGKQVKVYADETRPLLQGARLTAWELANQGIEATVICDSAAATALSRGMIDAVITGADRITANGDTANKIGTYPLAVLAGRHGVPFYVAAPATTFDAFTADGTGIRIEERQAEEIHAFQGRRATPPGARAWNPAFDVTPAELVTAFITEKGVLRPPFEQSLKAVLAEQSG